LGDEREKGQSLKQPIQKKENNGQFRRGHMAVKGEEIVEGRNRTEIWYTRRNPHRKKTQGERRESILPELGTLLEENEITKGRKGDRANHCVPRRGGGRRPFRRGKGVGSIAVKDETRGDKIKSRGGEGAACPEESSLRNQGGGT